MIKWKCLFSILAVIVQFVLLIKCPLFILRQLSPNIFLPQACREANQSNESTSADQQYLFTMVVYSSLYIGRWLETLIIHIHIYKFFFTQLTIKPSEFKKLCNKGLQKNRTATTLIVILIIYMLVHCESIQILGIIVELQHGRDNINCEDYAYEHHVIYWLPDIIRYLHDVAIRSMMILATVVIRELWLNEDSIIGSKSANGAEQNEPGNTDVKNQQNEPANADKINQQNEPGNIAENKPETYTIDEYLSDRNKTNEDHERRTKEYAEIGSKVERILEIFQNWFIMPWLLYFIGTSLNTNHILKAWEDGSSGEGYYDLSAISYMVYNFNQLSLLTIAFLCSKRMNTYHHKYFGKLRGDQLTKFKTASRMAMASMNKIEKDEHFDFVPRVWGTSIKVPVENSLYIVTMLLSIFFTICEALI